MSIGPSLKDEKIGVTTYQKTEYLVKKSLQYFNQNPLKNIFYLDLFLTIIGLFFGMSFSIPFYSILFFLAFIEMYKEIYLFLYPEKNFLLDNNKNKNGDTTNNK